ncbi:MAG: hypothetical protein U0103_05600 [Candidatus Obscuribacterales bacterium]
MSWVSDRYGELIHISYSGIILIVDKRAFGFPMPPLTPAAIEMIWWLSFVTLSILFVSGYAARRWQLHLNAQRLRELTDLQLYRKRLQVITNEMLVLANEMDQQSKFIPGSASQSWSKNLGIACDELVQLGETLPLIDQLLERKKIKAGREGILRSCRMAAKISRELHNIRQAEPKLLGDKQSGSKLP